MIDYNERNSMTMIGLCEISSPSFKFFSICSKLSDVSLFRPNLLIEDTKKDVLFITGDWNAKVGSQETPGVTGKFGLGVRNEAGQRLIAFCQENSLVIVNTLF